MLSGGNTVVFCFHAYEKMIQWIIFECRVLNENKPEVQLEKTSIYI